MGKVTLFFTNLMRKYLPDPFVFALYGLGFSASIPVQAPGHPLEKVMGIVSLSDTIFFAPMLITGLVVIITLPLLNAWLHPKQKENVIEINRSLAVTEEVAAGESILGENTFATKLNNSRLLSILIAILVLSM